MSLISYLKETKAELKFVKWPSQKQTAVYTALVVVISIFTAIYLGVFDYLFTLFIDNIIK